MKKNVTFVLTEKLIKVLEDLVQRTGLSKSDIIRRALENYDKEINRE